MLPTVTTRRSSVGVKNNHRKTECESLIVVLRKLRKLLHVKLLNPPTSLNCSLICGNLHREQALGLAQVLTRSCVNSSIV